MIKSRITWIGARSTHGTEKKDTRSFGGKYEGKRQTARPGVDWKIMLKRILKRNMTEGFGLDSSGSG
jgi:hypothetical protein